MALVVFATACGGERPQLAGEPGAGDGDEARVASSDDRFEDATGVQASGTVLDALDEPGGEPIWSLPNPGPFDGRLTLQTTGQLTEEYVEIVVPVKPNGTTAWVRRDEVEPVVASTSIVVDLSERTATLYDAGEALIEVDVGIGTDNTPTPEMTAMVDHVGENADPAGTYGAWTLGLNQHSEVLDTFNGGRPAIALHGTTNAGDIGQQISNGCVRIHNDDIGALAERTPLGTLVTIQA